MKTQDNLDSIVTSLFDEKRQVGIWRSKYQEQIDGDNYGHEV